jgi:TRAP-type mannitol/chloroaromatic compound transport system substrate-binding protein
VPRTWPSTTRWARTTRPRNSSRSSSTRTSSTRCLPDLKAILKYAAEAASTANTALAHDNYSKDLQELIVKHKVQVSRTTADVYKGQLAAWDKVTAKLEKEVDMFKEVNDSFKAWSRRVGFYHFTNEADYKMAYEHVQKIKLPV